MGEGVNRAVKSTQEQAVASWITYLNQVRLDNLIERLNQQDINLEDALNELAKLKEFLSDPSHILGSDATKHGEIAEHMQVNFQNARRAIQGLAKEYTFDGVGRTAPEDYLKNGQQIQSKFYNGLKQTLFNKHGLLEHMETYPNFVNDGGSYDIPKDQYEKMLELLDKYKNNPSELSASDFNLAKKIDEFLKNKGLELGKDINPAVANYKDVQQGVAKNTVDDEEKNIKKEDENQRKQAYDESKPSLKEGAKAAGISAAVEGGVTFCMAVARKRKQKKFADFTEEDWKEIGLDTGKGTIKGGVRGGAIYAMTNFTATPANVASAYVTAAFGVASQVKALERGEVSEEDFVINCEAVCLDTTVSAIASLAGQVLIPIPVLGAVIGNIAGEFVYDLCKKQANVKSQKIIVGYNTEMEMLNQKLDIQYMKVVLEIQKALQRFTDLEKMAFNVDVNIAFNGSSGLALEVGVQKNQILKNMNDINAYFM